MNLFSTRNWIRGLAAIVLLSPSVRIVAQDGPPDPRVAGIVVLPGLKLAILEFHEARPPFFEKSLVVEGQQSGINVLEINPENGTVKINLEGKDALLMITTTPGTTPPGGKEPVSLILQTANIPQVLSLYAGIVGRTVLQSPRLASLSLTLRDSPSNQIEAARSLEKLFLENEMATVK